MAATSYDPRGDRVLGQPARPTLLSVCFEPTNRCPGRCPYCLIEEHQAEAQSDQLIGILDRLLEHGTMRFGFGGGEPLLRRDVFLLGHHVRQHNAGSLLRTSGMFRIDPVQASDSFDWIDVSLDSIRKSTFEKCRPGVPYDVLIHNLVDLSSVSQVRVSILLTKRNQLDVAATIRWLAETGIKFVRFQRLVQRGRAVRTWRLLKLDLADEDAILADGIALATSLGLDAVELRSVSALTLCIVKSDGALYAGDPDGLVSAGSVYSETDLSAIASRLRDAQVRSYLGAVGA